MEGKIETDDLMRISQLVYRLPPGNALRQTVSLACTVSGTSKEELAQALGIGVRYLELLLTGKKSGRRKNTLALARELAAPMEIAGDINELEPCKRAAGGNIRHQAPGKNIPGA